MAAPRTSRRRRASAATWTLAASLLAISSLNLAHAYIPAMPSNETIPDANLTTSLNLKWPMGAYNTSVSYEWAMEDSTGIVQGALVHYTDANITRNNTTTTPWIAFIACDANSTGTDYGTDIFTSAQQDGAVGALLYSMYSATCHVNDEFKTNPDFGRILDIFAVPTAKVMGLVQSQFTNVNESLYYFFDPVRLNASAVEVARAQSGFFPPNSTFLAASLVTANATGNLSDPSLPGRSNGSQQPEKKQTTGLAMIILYAITGCVSLLFCIVILSGAVRAIRHPDRYGPRAADPTMGSAGLAQTRTTGLTRAILDTFPVIKFAVSSTSSEAPDETAEPVKAFDVEAGEAVPMKEIRIDEPEIVEESAVATSSEPSQSRPSSSSGEQDAEREVVPVPEDPVAALANDQHLGHDSCPICIVDFEEGDDLRVLPCEGRHQFHRDCVDPWLLESSGSCPLCREDFNALMGGEEGDAAAPAPQAGTGAGRRLTSILRFTRRRASRPSTAVVPPAPAPSDEPALPVVDVTPMRL